MAYRLTFLLFLLFQISTFSQQNVIINEIIASNVNGYIDSESGEYSDWIELYNNTQSTINISNFSLTDNITDTLKWVFPTNTIIEKGQYLIIWADEKNDGLHTNFKLSASGEELAIYDNNGILLDSITFTDQLANVSFGRDSADLNNWLYFSRPTPGELNNSGVNKLKLSEIPSFSQNAGFYDSSLLLEISSAKDGEIFYTIDGSKPNRESLKYTSPINLDSTIVIKAVFIEDGKLPSSTITRTFFVSENIDLPIVSISTDPKNLWDDKNGIYTVGTNGIDLWGVKANYWQDWERYAHFEFFDKNKQRVIDQGVGLAINGARRNMLQRSLRVFARSKYGSNKLNYRFFDEKNINEFSSIVLRNGGYPDYRHSIFADGFIQSLLIDEVDIDYQGYKPSILFVNGKYWGIYNIREKQNEEYLENNRNVNPDNLDILEYNMGVIEGDKNHYQNMLNFISGNDLAIQENYDSIKKWIDVNEYINYQIAEIYMANIDWPANNIKYWRPKTENGKWRWLLFDVDGGFGVWADYSHNTIEFATEPNSDQWNNKPWSTFLLRNLLTNSEFAQEFAQKFTILIDNTFHPTRVNSFIDKFSSKIKDQIVPHINRWSVGCSPTNPESKDGCTFSSFEAWENAINVRKTFAELRPKFMRLHLMNYFSIEDTSKIVVSSSNNSFGNIYLNDVNVDYNEATTIFKTVNLRIKAEPNVGYSFLRWEGDISSESELVEVKVENDLNLHAVFEPISENEVPSLINDDYTLARENSPYYIYDNVIVKENSILTVEEGIEVIISEDASIYIDGGLEAIGTETEPIIFTSSDNNSKWGALIFTNTQYNSKLYHTKLFNFSNGPNLVNHIGGISSYNSQLEISFLEMKDGGFPIFIQKGSIILRNSKISTSVISDLINVKNGKAIIEECEFIGNSAVDTDAIDYDNVENGIIRNNYIHDFLGDNSDGIDLGEGATNILVEGNFIFNCNDKGVSIGQGSDCKLINNIIVKCGQGVGIKDNKSYAKIENNTFFENDTSVACFEKSPGKGGGKAKIINTIFSKSISSSIYFDEHSSIDVSYSLSDAELLTGENNIFSNPLFTSEENYNFSFQDNSPCLNSGDPDSHKDSDGSRADIGANGKPDEGSLNIVINEINYNSSVDFNPKDWIELYNPNKMSIDISNWKFKDSDDAHIFNIPNQTIIAENGYLVICQDLDSFNQNFNNVNAYIGAFEFGLNNSGELVRLYDNYGNLIDSLTYDDEGNWPSDADGNGKTIQLMSHELDNSVASNWNASINYGTPGKKNDIISEITEPIILPSNFRLYQNYPNPFNPYTKIQYGIKNSTNVTLKIYDVLGREIKTLVNEKQKPGKYSVDFRANGLSSGIYYGQLVAGEYIKTIKMVFLK